MGYFSCILCTVHSWAVLKLVPCTCRLITWYIAIKANCNKPMDFGLLVIMIVKSCGNLFACNLLYLF